MLNLHSNPRRLAVLAGLFLALALAVVPTAAAVLPDGGYEPDQQRIPASGAVDPAPAVHTSSNSLDWSDVALAVAVGLTAFAITAAALLVTTRRRPVIANRSRSAESGDRPVPLRS